MKLSVIIPGYNTRKEWWRRCVRSVAAAVAATANEKCKVKNEKWGEVICVDDGSKEELRVEELESWKVGKLKSCGVGVEIKVVRLEKNSGLPTARNRGLEVASGEFVTFVDSDDEVREETYAKVIAAMESSGADVGVFGVNGVYAADGYQVHDIPEDKYYGALTPEDVGYLVHRRLFYYSWNKVFRRSFLEENKFQFYPEGVPCEDAIFNVGLVMRRAKWVTVAYEGYIYYRYDGSLLSSYKPTYVQGTRACTAAWRAYKASAPGVREGLDKYGLGWYDETSDADIVRGQWTNIWRRRSPFTLAQRWAYAAEHKAELGQFTPWVVAKKAAIMFARAHFYIGPVRRWYQKRGLRRIGAKVEELRVEKLESWGGDCLI